MAASRAKTRRVPSRMGGLSPSDMRWALAEERELIRLAAEARVRELTAIVDAYEAGDITKQEAEKRCLAYDERWDLPFVRDDTLDQQLRDQASDNVFGKLSPAAIANLRKAEAAMTPETKGFRERERHRGSTPKGHRR